MDPDDPDEFERLNYRYKDIAIYENLVAIGQPDGSVTVVDLDKGLHTEFQVYEQSTHFWWDAILMNKHYIVCAGTDNHKKVIHKVYSHSGGRLTFHFTLPNGPAYQPTAKLISDHKVLILS